MNDLKTRLEKAIEHNSEAVLIFREDFEKVLEALLKWSEEDD